MRRFIIRFTATVILSLSVLGVTAGTADARTAASVQDRVIDAYAR